LTTPSQGKEIIVKVDQESTQIIERVDDKLIKFVKLIDKSSNRVMQVIEIPTGQSIKLVDEQTGDLIKLVDQRSSEVIKIANISMERALSCTEFILVIGYLFLSFVTCFVIFEKFYGYSSIKKIIFLTFLLFVFSSPSSCIEYSLLLFFSFAYFTIILTLNCFFLLICCLKFAVQIIFWCIFIFSLVHPLVFLVDTRFQSQILMIENQANALINLCEFSAYDTHTLLYRGTRDGFRTSDFPFNCHKYHST
jgi:hypothetical protein